MKPIRCPKCRAVVETLLEEWRSHTINYAQSPSGEIEPEGILHEGNPCGVFGNCACGHSWRLRGVFQITQLAGHPEYDPPAPKKEFRL